MSNRGFTLEVPPGGFHPMPFPKNLRSSSSPTGVEDRVSLEDADLIGVMGDIHGDLIHALQVLRIFADRGIRAVIQLGDFGVIWPGENWQVSLRDLSRALTRNGQTLYFVDGNHDYHPRILGYPIDENGYRWVSWNVAHLPRGFRTQVGKSHVLAALGGANSTDRDLRSENVDWWPTEQISEDDLTALGTKPVDVLVGHESPILYVRDPDPRVPPEIMEYARQSNEMFRRAVVQTRPQITFGGHYHLHRDQIEEFSATTPLHVRSVVLDMNGNDRVSQAILDPKTLEIEFLLRNGTPVP